MIAPIAVRFPRFFGRFAKAFLLGLAAFSFGCEGEKAPALETAGIGEQREIDLSSASKAKLNACSALLFDPEKAIATLDGEAFFELAEGQILTVRTPRGQVVLRSAAANVRARAELFEIRIFEGECVFEPSLGPRVRLEKGDRIRLDSAEQTIKKAPFQLKKPRPEWLDGFSAFENEPLRNVFLELERQFDVRTKLPAEAARQPFSGFFEQHNLEKALDEIGRVSGFGFEKKGQKLVVKNR